MSEQAIQTRIMDMLFTNKRVAWAYVTTTGKVKGRGGHWFTMGYPGISDIIGQLIDGRILAIEVKQPGEKPSEKQDDFLELVNKFNGVAGWATSVEEAEAIINAPN